MYMVLEEMAKEVGIEAVSLRECRNDILKGIYEAYLQTQDRNDTIDSLERAARKVSRQSSPRSSK